MCLLVFPMCLCVCLSPCGQCICLCVYFCENAFVCVCLWSCTVVGEFCGLTLRGRVLPVHVDTPFTHLDQRYPVERSLVVGFIHPTEHHHTALRLASVEKRQWADPWRTVKTALSESCACLPIKALKMSSLTDAEIESRSD